MYYHVFEFTPVGNNLEQFIHNLIIDWVDLGKIAVTVFFAISGFVIPFSLFKPSASPLRDFAISRFFRLYPAYWLSMVLFILLTFALRKPQFHLDAILINATMLQQFVGVPNLIGVYWTLQIELIFYVLCAVMFAIGIMQKHNYVVAAVWICLFFAFLLGLGRHITGKNLPVAIPLALSVMYFGFLWRALIMQNAVKLRKHIYAILVGFAVFLPIILYLAYNNNMPVVSGAVGYNNHQGLNYTLTYYLAIGIFILGTTKLKITSSLTSYLGKISYSLYLVGSTGTVLSTNLIKAYFGYVPIPALIVLCTVIGVGVSSLVYRYIEAPSIALGRSLAHNIRKNAPLTAREIEESEVL